MPTEMPKDGDDELQEEREVVAPPNPMSLFAPQWIVLPIELAAKLLEGDDRLRCEQALAQGLGARCVAQKKLGEPAEFVEADEDEQDAGDGCGREE